ncbi:MAG: type II toxin-antitoxin system RelE/ParE family toxin [Anaerolineae bacterium]|nr:type II toxin-antitoxin system RelE/ParE family toxin [Anaerolineae bacterium]
MSEPPLYTIRLSRQAERRLMRLPRDLGGRLRRVLHALQTEPRPRGAEPLKGHDLYRLRVGDWRIVYAIEDAQLLVLVIRIAARGEAYRDCP